MIGEYFEDGVRQNMRGVMLVTYQCQFKQITEALTRDKSCPVLLHPMTSNQLVSVIILCKVTEEPCSVTQTGSAIRGHHMTLQS